MYWDSHEEGLTERPNVLKRLKHELFRALAKLALTIFDLVIAPQNFAKQAEYTVIFSYLVFVRVSKSSNHA